MFLVRAVFWILVVMALLPEQRDTFLAHWPILQQEAHERGVDTWMQESVQRAQDLAAVCRRQPDLCRDATSAWDSAWQGAYGQIQGALQSLSGATDAFQPLRKRSEERGTLSPDDLEPAWAAPGRDRKV